MIKKLRSLLSRRDKKILVGLALFSIFMSFVEVGGVAIIWPFIRVVTNFDLVYENQYYAFFYQLLGFEDAENFVITFGIFLIGFFIFRALITLLHGFLMTKFTQERYHILVYGLFENYMGLSYREFLQRSSSDLTQSITTEARNLGTLISTILGLVSQVLTAVLIYAAVLYFNYKITLILTAALALNSWFMVKTVTPKIKQSGEVRAASQRKFFEILTRTFGSFKMIKLYGNEYDLLRTFAQASAEAKDAQIAAGVLNKIPPLFLQAFAFSLIVFIVTFFVWQYGRGVSTALPLVAIFVLALYRMIPAVNGILSGYNQIVFLQRSLEIVHNDLIYQPEELGDEPAVFEQKITIENLGFEYEDDKPILEDIHLVIHKGEKIALIGESGGGKSTLVDIIIGLYKPKTGVIKSDDEMIDAHNMKSWRKKIGYIPQSIYLFNGTVGDNIAFGLDYDEAKIDKCLKQARMFDYLKKHKGRDTEVGEGGVRLSGGQKQRIAIARALYTDPDILVLDEATSALDEKIETRIMDSIYQIGADKTLIIVAHRLSTISRCDKIYRIENQNLGDATAEMRKKLVAQKNRKSEKSQKRKTQESEKSQKQKMQKPQKTVAEIKNG